MLYEFKMSKQDIESILYLIEKQEKRHKELCESTGVYDELYFTKKIKDYLEGELTNPNN